tara:strand:+ start:206 stop:511 length:306 start_codon:yes stop_codon:yes gene_type:complete
MTEQPFDEAYKTIKDAIGAVQAVRHLAAEADTLRAEVARLRASLQVTAAVLQAEMGRTGGKPFTGWWTIPGIDRRLTCQSVLNDANDVLSPDALAHGEADQ